MKSYSQKKFNRTLNLLFLPGFIGFCLFYVLPMFWSLMESTRVSLLDRSFAGLAHYQRIFQNKYFILAVRNNLLLLLYFTVLCMLLGLFLAVIVHKSIRGNFLVLLVAPIFLPSSALSIVWKEAFLSQSALFRPYLEAFLPTRLLGVELSSLLLLMLWQNTGLITVLLSCALNSLDKDIIDAARMDGASSFRLLLSIKLPLIRPTLVFSSAFCIYRAFSSFREVYLLFGNYPPGNIYQVQNYMQNHFNKLNYAILSAAALSMTVIVFAVFFPLLSIGEWRKKR